MAACVRPAGPLAALNFQLLGIGEGWEVGDNQGPSPRPAKL